MRKKAIIKKILVFALVLVMMIPNSLVSLAAEGTDENTGVAACEKTQGCQLAGEHEECKIANDEAGEKTDFVACTKAEGCLLADGHEEADCVLEKADEEPEFVACTKTEGCTLEEDHEEADCVLEKTDEEPEFVACTKTEGCTLEEDHEEADCVLEKTDKEPEFVACTKTEGCTLAEGHEEPDCVIEKPDEDAEEEWLPCQTEGCEMVKDHPGECSGAATYADEVAQVADKTYETLASAVEAANEVEGGATIELLEDVELSEKLTISGNVTISGEKTITRASGYTGTLFDVNAGASLTLDGGLTIDGANSWVFDQNAYDSDLNNMNQVTEAEKYVTPEGDAPVALAYMITTKGTVNLNNVTIQNHYSSGSGIVNASTGANINLTKAKITHCAITKGSGLVVNASTSKWEVNDPTAINVTMNDGTVIDGNYVGGNHGVFKIYMNTTFTMNGGEIKNTTGWNSNGVAVGAYWANFIMNGGTICSNSSVYGPNNGRNAAIYIHSAGSFEMNGGTICHNAGRARGGVDAPYTGVESNASTVKLNGGSISDNISINGNADKDVSGGAKLVITGGTYTQDVSQWLAPSVDLIDNGDGTWSVVKDTTVPTVTDVRQEYQTKSNGRIKVTVTFSEPVTGLENWDWSNADGTQYTTYFFRTKDVNLRFKDVAGNEATDIIKVDFTKPEVTAVDQVYEEKDGTRIKVTLTFNRPVDEVKSGSTTWRKANEDQTAYYTYVYRTKDLEVTFKDAVACIPGSYVVSVDKTAPTIKFENTSGSPVAARTVTLKASEPIQAPDGWTEVVGSNGTEWTKTFTQNTKTKDFVVKDLIGNPSEPVVLDVKNVDSTVPTGTVTYSTTEPTNGDVTVTLTTNTDCETPEGWTKVNWRRFTKVYSENGSEEVLLTSRTGIPGTEKVVVEVSNIDKLKPEITLKDKDGNVINGKEITVEAARSIDLTKLIFASATDNVDTTVEVKNSGNYRFGTTLDESKSGELTKSMDPTKVGYWCVKYTATDKAGNAKVVAVYVHVVDTTAPTININKIKDANINDEHFKEITEMAFYDIAELESLNLNNKVTDLSGKKYAYMSVDKLAGYGLVEGENTLTVTDQSGNATTVKFFYDTTKPVFTVVDKDSNNVEYRGVVKVEAVKDLDLTGVLTVTANDAVSGVVDVVESGHYRFGDTVENADKGGLETTLDSTRIGYWLVKYTATDKAGNTAYFSVYVNIVDETAPNVKVNGTVKDDYYETIDNMAFHDIAGLKEVKINDTVTDLSGSKYVWVTGADADDYGVKKGTNTITLTDAAGNVTTLTFVYGKPAATGTTTGSGSSSSSSSSDSSDSSSKPVEVYYVSTPAVATSAAPATGDASNAMLWISVMGLAAVAATFVLKKRNVK